MTIFANVFLNTFIPFSFNLNTYPFLAGSPAANYDRPKRAGPLVPMSETRKPSFAQSLPRLLKEYGIHPAKRLGQHFLLDERHLRNMLQIPGLSDLAVVLEVGPGPGNLTELLLQEGAKVLAVELDRRFVKLLNDRFADQDDFTLIHADILARGKLNPDVIAALANTWSGGWAVISNLPYQVGTTVIVEALHLPVRPRVICATIQKEVAERMLASPGTKSYSILTILVQSYTIVERVSIVPAGAFWPKPAVDSATIRLTTKAKDDVSDPAHLRQMVSGMFQHRRKTLRSGYLKRLPISVRDVNEMAFEKLGIDPSARAEQISVDDFIGLSNMIVSMKSENLKT